MVVLEHVLVCLQIEVSIVLCILSKADRAILIHNASNFDYMSSAQLAVILVADYLDFLAYTRILS